MRVRVRQVGRLDANFQLRAPLLGLLAWLFLEAQLTLYAVEINVTAVRGLWPRSLFPPPLTEKDLEAYRLYAEAEQRRPDVKVEVEETDQPTP